MCIRDRPITLITTLLASLFVAYIINPVFAVDFMKPHGEGDKLKLFTKSFYITIAGFVVVMFLSHMGGNMFLRNVTLSIFPVSYTHLDVYKRQVQNHAVSR